MTTEREINVSASPGQSSPLGLALGVIGIYLLTFVAHLPALWSGFVWDDDAYVLQNRALRSFDGLRTIWIGIFPSPRAYAAQVVPQYSPMALTSFWLEYRFWAANPAGYHAINLLLHATAALLVWVILRKLSVPCSWLIAAIFAIHPVQVQSVAWITQRQNVLAGVFYLCSMLIYLRFCGLDPAPKVAAGTTPLLPTERWKIYALAMLLFACALLSTSLAGSLPIAILLLLWWKRARLAWEDVGPLVPFLALALLMAVFSTYMERHGAGAQGRDFSFSWIQRLIIAGHAVWFYVYKLIWPAKLVFTYEKWPIELPQQSWQLVFPAALIAAVVTLAVQRERIGRGPLVAVLFFLVTLFPVLGFFNPHSMRYTFVADHFQYLACIGLIALLVPACYRLIALKEAAIPVAAIVVLIFGALSWRQARIYRDERILWAQTVASAPDSWIAQVNLARMLLAGDNEHAPDEDLALEHFRAARKTERHAIEPMTGIGLIAERRGDLKVAEEYFLAAIEECQRDGSHSLGCAEPLYNLGRLYTRMGRPDDAIRAYESTLQWNPWYSKAMTNLGVCYAARQELPKAIYLYQQSLQIDPESISTRTNLGNAYLQAGNITDALDQWGEVLRMDPNNANVPNGLGLALAHLGKWDEAINMFKTALKRNPDLEPARKNLEAAIRNKQLAATRPSTTAASTTRATTRP